MCCGPLTSSMESRVTDIATTDDLFYGRTGLDPNRVQALVDDALEGADDGELFL